MYIDTHAHLNYEGKYGDFAQLLHAIRGAGVDKVIDVGWDLASSQLAAKQAAQEPMLYFAAGIHPSDAACAKDGDLDGIAALLAHPKGVAVGEIGLDYHYADTDKAKQARTFCAQLDLAHALGLPVVIHSRDATEDTLDLLRQNRAKLAAGGVMHCFSGSPETAREYIRLGLYISFAGPVTFKNARRADEAARAIPADRLLAETDSPYLAPEPLRGTLNTPANVPLVYAKLAALRGEDPEELTVQICKNAHTLFTKLSEK